MCSDRIRWLAVPGSRTHPGQALRPRWWPARRSSSRPGRLSDPPAQRPRRRQAGIYRSTPWPRGIIRAFRLQCPAMFLLADLVELVRRPFAALRTIDQRRSLAAGLVALGLSITLPAAVAELAALAPFRPPLNLGSLPSLTAQGADIYARWVYGHRFLLPIYGIAISFVLWVAAAGVIHLIARTLGGRGDFAGLAKLVGYAALVGLVALPVALVDALLKLQGATQAEAAFGQLAGFVAVAIFLWQNALLVIAARDHYAISTQRAVAAVIGPIGAVIVLALALIILGIVLAIIAQQT